MRCSPPIGRPCLLLPALTVASALLTASNAGAALTSSEQAQINAYVAEGRVATAPRVRALIARPDLTADESASSLEAALVPLVFQDARAAYLREMIDGEASLPSRGVVAVAVTRALAARADAILSKHEADLDEDAAAQAELLRITAFLDAEVANAGHPRGPAHDPSAGIGAQSYDDAAKALAAIIERHARWLKGDATIPAAAEPVRAQLQLAILDMTNDTTTRRFDAADRLWLTGSRRTPLTELGILVLDDGHADPARIDAVRGLLARVPGARDDVEAVALTPLPTGIRARGEVLAVRADAPPPAPFGDDVSPPPISAELSALARALAPLVVRRASDVRPELRARAESDAAAVGGDPARALGVPADATAAASLATAVQLLLLDAPRALEVACVRLVAGHPEAAALLSDALGLLSALAPRSAAGLSLALGHVGDDGVAGAIAASNVRLAPAGFVTGFSLAGHSWSFTRDDAGRVNITRDGAPVTLAMLEHARTPVAAGPIFSGGGVVFAKMSGAPRAGVSAGGRVRVVGDGAIGTAAPGDDASVEASVEVTGEAAIVVRAAATSRGWKGVALVLDATSGALRVSLRAVDDAGNVTTLAAPVTAGAAGRAAVRLAIKGPHVDARVGDLTLHAEAPAPLAHGDVAIVVRHDGSFDATGWSVKRP